MSVVKNILAALGLVALLIFVIALVISPGRHGQGDKVAVVTVQGVILDPFDVTQLLEEYAKRKDVKAVVIRINTPGGAVGPSQEIYRAVQRLRKIKPVVASMGSVAASGGYYIAAAAERIVANPGTITGSIGVIVQFMNAQELLDKIGLKGRVIKSGKYKDAGSALRDITPEEAELIQAVVDDVNAQFVRAVAEGRNKKFKEIDAIADGRIFSGSQALELGLVDRLGDLRDAVDLSAKLAGVKGSPEVIYPVKKGDLLSSLFGTALKNNLQGYLSGMRIMYLLPNAIY